MKHFCLAFIFVCSLGTSVYAQISHGSQPANWGDHHMPADIPFVTTNELNRELLAMQDEVVDQHKDAPYRFGVENEISWSTENSGRWIINTNSDRAVWQLGIHCPDASSISLLFTTFHVPEGAELYIWNVERTRFLGSFNHLNNSESNVLPVGLLPSDKVVIEYSVPISSSSWGELVLGQIVHGYRDMLIEHFEDASEDRGPYGISGSCNVNVNCPSGAAWQNEKRAVALIVSGGYAICTGALVNNTAQNGTPYFLTANHCLGGSTANWIFYFNHESTACVGSNGPTNQSVTGATLKAHNAGSDFALLQLNSVPPAGYNVYYAGWDWSDSQASATSAVCIHHPDGDVKKISFENNAPYHSTGNGAQVWWIDNWESGVTEPGSSGSPLFNQNHRIIGQLYGGQSACNGSVGNGQYDFYGRFGVSWNTGSSASARLKDWLDPQNTGVTFLNGYPNASVAEVTDAGVSSINGVSSTVCGATVHPEITLTNFGNTTLQSCVIHYQLNGGAEQTFPWSGTLAENQEATINLPVLNLTNGANTLEVWTTNPNNGTDENVVNDQIDVTFSAFIGDYFVYTLNLVLDNYPDETSWQVTDADNTILFSSGGNYAGQADGSTVTSEFCLASGCYDFTIFDAENDGICCAYGNGSFAIYDENNDVAGFGASFSNQKTVELCVNVASTASVLDDEVLIYPNPANNYVHIQGMKGLSLVELYDATGRRVYVSQESGTACRIDLSKISGAWYSLRITNGDGMLSRALFIQN